MTEKLTHTRITAELVTYFKDLADEAVDGPDKQLRESSLNAAMGADVLVALYSDKRSRRTCKTLIELMMIDRQTAMMVMANLVAACAQADRRLAQIYEVVNDIGSEDAAEKAKEATEAARSEV